MMDPVMRAIKELISVDSGRYESVLPQVQQVLEDARHETLVLIDGIAFDHTHGRSVPTIPASAISFAYHTDRKKLIFNSYLRIATVWANRKRFMVGILDANIHFRRLYICTYRYRAGNDGAVFSSVPGCANPHPETSFPP
jgi:hypothetical protein